jgi:large subunit ribosomal protein L17
MRHLKRKSKLGKPADQRKALIRSLLIALFKEEKIITTYKRAKEVSRWADKLITMGKRNSLSAKRLSFRLLQDHKLVKKLFDEIAPRFKDINGGYTRVIKYKNRKGDNALLSVLEFTKIKEEIFEEKKKLRLLRRKKKEEKLKEDTQPVEEKKEEKIKEKEKEVKEKKFEKKEKKRRKQPKEREKGFLPGLKKFFRKKPNE